MPNHQASEQMLGYLYQVRYALALLLENDNSDFQISIEKFDDVAFSKDGKTFSSTISICNRKFFTIFFIVCA